MNFINVCLCLFLVVGISDLGLVNSQGLHRGTHGTPGHGKMTPKIKNTILRLHNEYRRTEGASNMIQLKWSRQLQRDAQIFAGKCRYAHAYGKWGENLFKVESHLPDDVLVERAINEWYFEKMSWKFTPDCSEACHYTQVVWSTAKEIGCSFKRCTTLFLMEEFIPNGWMLVCYYNPQGNIIGQMPYTPGNACSACPKGYPKCQRGLCNRAPPVSRYLPQSPAKPPPKPRPTPRVYRAPPNPPAHHQRQNPGVHNNPHKHAHQPGTAVRSQPQPAYKPPPRQQRRIQQSPPPKHVIYQQPPPPPQSHVYQPPAPPKSPVYQYQHSQHNPAPQHHVAQPRAAVPPRANTQQQPSPAQPTIYRRRHYKPYKPHTRPVWRGQEKIPQPQPEQQTVQQSSHVQYVSGKVLTGWMPVKATSHSTAGNTNQTSYYPQTAAVPKAPAHAQQQTVRTQPVPSGQQKQHYQYPVQQSPHVYNSNSAAQNPPQASMHYQSQYQTPQNPAQPINQHQYPSQQQTAQVQQSPLHQSAPNHHQQHQPRPAPAQNMQQQYAVQPAPSQQRRHEYIAPAQIQQQQYRNNPQYIQTAPNAHVPQNSIPVQRPQAQAYHQQGQPQYAQRPGPVPNQQMVQRPQQQTHSVYVDPRPIYVPPEPVQTTTLPPPPPPPPPSCLDGDKNCKHWEVYCKSNPYVHDNCRLTCKTCSIPTPPPAQVKLIQTTSTPTTTPRPSIIPSNPPSPITPVPAEHKPLPRRQPQRQTLAPPVPNNNYGTTTVPFYPPTTSFNSQQGTTAAAPYMGPGGGPAFGPCRDYDKRCKQWAKYCGIDEYVDDMCRLTCMMCHKI